MSADLPALDPLAVPLTGVHLIEASAGTGKTYTIAGLYLRLLLESPWEVGQILVVTFTNAATNELRGRVRQRIREALAVLDGAEGDQQTRDLLAPITDPARARQCLADALVRMDEASLLTIHAFCQRVLQELALESATLFDAELLADDSELRRRAMEDFWRRRFQAAPRPRVEWARRRWAGPTALLADLGPLFRQLEARLLAPPLEQVERLEEEAQLAFDALAGSWLAEGDTVSALLRDDPGLRRSHDSYRADRLEEAAQSLDAWLSRGFSLVTPSGFELFTDSKIARSLKKGKAALQHPFFTACEDLARRLAELDRLLLAELYLAARDELATAVAQAKARRRLLGFDDLLVQLDQALAGPLGQGLAARIRARLPVALVDEFQDTDPVQYRIFRRLYAGREDSGLFLIGDPKQAIYGFRGADIFTYALACREAPQSARYTLGVNWRSSAAMVEAVNRLFDRSHPFLPVPPIGFQPARPAGRADETPLIVQGLAPAALQIWLAERTGDNCSHGLVAKYRAEAGSVQALAAEAARLIRLGAQGQARIGEQPLVARDIAFLVRNRFEAAAVREALQGQAVASVFYSQDSVFDTEEARELVLLLGALGRPSDERALRSALSTTLLGLTASDLDLLADDDGRWEPCLERFHGYHRMWLGRGFMSMFLRLLQAEGVVSRLLSAPWGERRLTNLLQLAELLQIASEQHEGPDNLLRWLSDGRARPDGNAEEQQLRLESDEDLVKVVTLHKSKGLEYPLVFLPFAWGARARPCTVPLAFHGGDEGRLYFDLGTAELTEHCQAAERERLAEDLRLLYVGLTRARYQCHLVWGAIKGAADSALAYLLHDGVLPSDDAPMLERLRALDRGDGSIAQIRPLAVVDAGQWVPRNRPSGELRARAPAGSIDDSWRIASYSALVAGHELAGAVDAERLAETGLGAGPPDSPAEWTPHGFPAGAQAGLFLHELLERLSFPAATTEVLGPLVETLLGQYGFDPRWRPAVERLIGRVLDTPLDELGSLRLRGVEDRRRRNEMAFHFPLESVSDAALDRVLDAGGDRLRFGAVRGLMKGYIDLVFEHRGLYYLADYKSNRLGVRTEDYDHAAMARAMREHRYDLQYLIYAVALHRYLAQRIDDYAYERHFGGAYYLFLRGLDPEQGSRYGVFFERPDAGLIQSLDALFSGASGP